MPLQVPNLDDRRYQQLLDEAVARIPVHTPEWTNFNHSDPGFTLVQVFAFLTENLLYRANRVPELNRKRFLQLLGVPLQPAASAEGLLSIANERGPLKTITLNADIEVRAGPVPYRTSSGLDVLPIEAVPYFKLQLPTPPQEQLDHYRSLYASFLSVDPQSVAEPVLYQPVPLASRGDAGVDLGGETVDHALWIALLVRPVDKSGNPQDDLRRAREAIANKTLNLGLVPQIDADDLQRQLLPGGGGRGSQRSALIEVALPRIPPSGGLPNNRQPDYQTIRTIPAPTEPEVFEVTLPSANQLILWNNLDPLEPGADQLPPSLDDTAVRDRLITWLRLKWPEGVRARLLWAGINVTPISQRSRVTDELLPEGTGEPDQQVSLSQAPVIPGSVNLTVVTPNASDVWQETDDLLAAGSEVQVPDLRMPPGVIPPPERPSKVFLLDAEAGQLQFGDGLRGARPPLAARMRVTYEYGVGRLGNVGVGAVNTSPALPAGMKVSNPVRTWGGADAESIDDGEKQVARYLQHRDRLVTEADFETITLRTPGVEIGRVEVLPAYNPGLARNEPGNAPGAVTVMLIPRYSPTRPDAPEPDQLFLKAVCDYLDPRRLVTTELFLIGPEYKPVWVSVGIEVVGGRNFETAVVREAVKQRIQDYLAPLTPESAVLNTDPTLLATPLATEDRKGWPLGKPVLASRLEVEVARVPGVAAINGLLLAGSTGDPTPRIDMKGLQLPRLDGILVNLGDPIPIDQVRGDITQGGGGPPTPPRLVPLPAIPNEC